MSFMKHVPGIPWRPVWPLIPCGPCSPRSPVNGKEYDFLNSNVKIYRIVFGWLLDKYKRFPRFLLQF